MKQFNKNTITEGIAAVKNQYLILNVLDLLINKNEFNFNNKGN